MRVGRIDRRGDEIDINGQIVSGTRPRQHRNRGAAANDAPAEHRTPQERTMRAKRTASWTELLPSPPLWAV